MSIFMGNDLFLFPPDEHMLMQRQCKCFPLLLQRLNQIVAGFRLSVILMLLALAEVELNWEHVTESDISPMNSGPKNHRRAPRVVLRWPCLPCPCAARRRCTCRSSPSSAACCWPQWPSCRLTCPDWSALLLPHSASLCRTSSPKRYIILPACGKLPLLRGGSGRIGDYCLH